MNNIENIFVINMVIFGCIGVYMLFRGNKETAKYFADFKVKYYDLEERTYNIKTKEDFLSCSKELTQLFEDYKTQEKDLEYIRGILITRGRDLQLAEKKL
jgi:hypothetical protein